MEIRILRPSDNRSVFQSGDEALDRFLHRYAGQNQFRHYLGVNTWRPLAIAFWASQRSPPGTSISRAYPSVAARSCRATQ